MSEDDVPGKVKPDWDEMYCSSCGSIIKKRAEICVKCGVRIAPLPSALSPTMTASLGPVAYSERSRLTAGSLGVLLGFLGVHSFYLGQIGKGILQIVASLTVVGSLWGFIEGIIILTGGNWKDAEGKPLRKYND